MNGISEGFYDDPFYLNGNDCLDMEAVEDIHSMFESMRHGANWFDKTLRVITAMLTFNSSAKASCKEHQWFADSVAYCFTKNNLCNDAF